MMLRCVRYILFLFRMMSDFFSEVLLTDDEMALLYYRIWEDSSFGCFTALNFAAWVNKNRGAKLRELRSIGLTEQEQKRILRKEEATLPLLFKELVKYAYSFGLNFLMTSMKPIVERENYIMLGNI